MRKTQALRAVAALAAAFFFSSCAAGLAANKKSPGVVAGDEFRPSRPPQLNFGPDPTLTCPQHGNNGAVQEAANERLHEKAPQPDGRLCAIADTLLGWPAGTNNELPPEPVRVFLSQYFGVPNPVRQILLTTLETEKDVDVASALVEPLASFAEGALHPIYGLFTERVKKGITKVAMVMYDEDVALEPLPRKLAFGTSAPLAGQLLPPLKSPRVQVVDPLGKLEKAAADAQSFHGEVKCADKPGKILVQVVGDHDGADVVAANFPVYCGIELPTAGKMPGKAGPIDPVAAEQKLTALLDSDRTSVGLKPLSLNAALSAIARNLAEKRAAGKGVSSADLMQQLKDADIATPLILLTEGQSFSVDEVYTRFSESPPDRANAMRADVTDVGIGAAKGPDVAGKPTIIVTELFVTQLPPPDPQELKSKLYAAIAKKRAAAGKSELTKDAVLDSIAQKYADLAAAAGGPVPAEKTSEIMAPLYKESMTVNQLGGFVPNEEGALSVADQGTVLGDAKLIGVGVAVGRSPQFGKNSPFVMVLLGTRHAPTKAAPKKRR